MEQILIIDDSEHISRLLAQHVLPDLGYESVVAHTGRQGLHQLRMHLPDLILLDLQLPDIDGLDLLRLIGQEGYDVPVILMTAHGSENTAVEAFRLGARNYLIKPFSDIEAKAAIDQAMRERRLQRDKERLTQSLQQRVQELTVLYRIGKSVTGLMEQEQLLERIVEASVYITQAEEGFLLLRSSQTDELYLRAAKNLGEQRAQSLRMPIDDTLAGQVVRTGKPIRLNGSQDGMALKVKTGFLVRALLQVPLAVGGQVIGVLAVDNQQSKRTFSENDQYLLSALADYAAIAIENARLYEQVKQSEARYKELFANAYDLIFMLDRDLHITNINKVGEQVMGYPIETLVEQNLRAFCSPASWASVRGLFADLLQGKSVAPFELELFHRDGEPIYLEVSAQVMLNGDKLQPNGLHCIARNLTERRRLEEQLVQSEKLSAIGQLVAGVAHELNNPLTSVSGYAQLLLRNTSLADETLQDVEQIHLQAERAARIVRNLLIFAREHKPERSAVSINEVMRNALALQNYHLKVENIAVVTSYSPQLPTTIADPHQLQQVFVNLIINARQAMVDRGGRGTLTLRTGITTMSVDTSAADGNGRADTHFIEVVVSDTGVGIPDHDLSRIFNPFFTTKPAGKGTGLGLSICFGIVKEHGGQIWAESTIGVGTSVHVALPVRSTQPLFHHAPDDAPIVIEPEQSYAVLIVDDEEPVLRFVSRLLHEMGHRPHIVASGDAALAVLREEQFDAILSDVRMPGMNGFDLHQAVSEQSADLAARFIFMTGDTFSVATKENLEQYGNPVLSKPFSIEQLEQALQRLMKDTSVDVNDSA